MFSYNNDDLSNEDEETSKCILYSKQHKKEK
jgi:hypothetical protein